MENFLELVAHEAVDDEVAGGVEDEEPVHQAGQAEEPSWGSEVRTPEDIASQNHNNNEGKDLHEDAIGHEELCTVNKKPGEVTDEKHNDDADEDASKVHLVTGGSVAV